MKVQAWLHQPKSLANYGNPDGKQCESERNIKKEEAIFDLVDPIFNVTMCKSVDRF